MKKNIIILDKISNGKSRIRQDIKNTITPKSGVFNDRVRNILEQQELRKSRIINVKDSSLEESCDFFCLGNELDKVNDETPIILGEIKDNRLIEKADNLSEYYFFCEDFNNNIIAKYEKVIYAQLKTLIDENIFPEDIDHFGVYDSSDVKIGNIIFEKNTYSEQKYCFGVLSDVHNQSNKTAEPDEDFQRALRVFKDESVNFTCICGDITEYGYLSELEEYESNINVISPNAPVYTCRGNHDCQRSGLDDSIWEQYTKCKRNFVISEGNDRFIFFSMSSWSLGVSGKPYLDEDIIWLKDQLNSFRKNRVFIFTHLFFPNLAGNFKERYPSSNWLGGEQLKKLNKLRRHFINTVWFSGHSHWKWYLQQYEENSNIDKDGGWTVHISSCTSPIDSSFIDGAWSRDSKPLESEGAIVDVYDDYIDIRTIDLKNSKYLSTTMYRLDTRIYSDIEEFGEFKENIYPDMNEVGFVNIRDFSINETKPGSEFIDISQEDEYITLHFKSTSTGLLIKTEDFIKEEHSSVKLEVVDYLISTDGVNFTKDNVPEKIGFYKKGGGYTLNSCENILEMNSSGQIQLNVSSSYLGILPIYLKIKFKLGYK